jgi:hypothetical protein
MSETNQLLDSLQNKVVTLKRDLSSALTAEDWDRAAALDLEMARLCLGLDRISYEMELEEQEQKKFS